MLLRFLGVQGPHPKPSGWLRPWANSKEMYVGVGVQGFGLNTGMGAICFSFALCLSGADQKGKE